LEHHIRRYDNVEPQSDWLRRCAT